MGKFAALAILLTVAAVIYFINPGVRVEVSDTIQEQIKQAKAAEPNIIDSINSNPVPNTEAAGSNTPLSDKNDDDEHNHAAATDNPRIPQFIKDSLEAKRVPASELVEIQHPDGSVSMDLKGQFQHVPVAVIGEDGKVKIIEAKIEPRNE